MFGPFKKRKESSCRQQPELFKGLSENIRLSWFIQKRNESSRRQRSVQTVDNDYFHPYRGLNEQFTLNESSFGKHKFDWLKCINAYVDTAHDHLL